jgi:chromosome partitioning protein
MPRRIAFISEKGGVGKTITALNVAVILARRGERVLLIDSDPQGNSSYVLAGEEPDPPTLGQILLGSAEAGDAIRGTGVPGLDVLPARDDLADANDQISSRIGRERLLAQAMEECEADYGYILLDTTPARSLLTVNALTYVQEAIIPVDPSVFAMIGLGKLQGVVEEVRKLLNRRLRISGIVVTKTTNTKVSRDVEAQLRGHFGAIVFAATIPTNVKVEEASSRRTVVVDYAPDSAGAVAYQQLAREIADGSVSERSKGRTGRKHLDAAQADDAA